MILGSEKVTELLKYLLGAIATLQMAAPAYQWDITLRSPAIYKAAIAPNRYFSMSGAKLQGGW